MIYREVNRCVFNMQPDQPIQDVEGASLDDQREEVAGGGDCSRESYGGRRVPSAWCIIDIRLRDFDCVEEAELRQQRHAT